VSIWIAVVFDLIDKIRELALSGDGNAKGLEDKYETYLREIERGNEEGVKSALQFEREILTTCKDQLQLFDRVIDRALAAWRDVDGIESPAPEVATGRAIASPVGVVRKGNDNGRRGTSHGQRSTAKKAGGAPPTVNASASDPGKTIRQEGPVTRERPARKLTEGTMKARTVELLRKAGRPMNSGEVAKRMNIGSGYASVNLSRLRRDGFLSHNEAGYVVK
jgi:hypothetical protein